MLTGRSSIIVSQNDSVDCFHSRIALIDKVNEKDRVGDAICMFGIGEGRKPAFEVAQILSKVGAQIYTCI